MSIQLVIAEKPSVARSIAGVIGADQKRDGYMEGNGYLVSWCIGHLVSLADAGAYDEHFKKWRYDDLPILPQEWQYIIPAEKKGQFAVLRSLMERPDVTGLVCATDAGREGELIFRFVYQMAGCKKPFKRLWISSMEDAAIREGFAHLKPGADYRGLGSIDFRAAARSVLLIGRVKREPNVRVIVHDKSSLAPEGKPVAFCLDPETGFSWIGEYDITADELLSGAGGNTATKTEQAERLILDLLADGKELASEDIEKAATEAGISARTVRAAKRNLDGRITSKRIGAAWYHALKK